MYVQAQDARAPGYLDSDDKDSVAHRADLRQAYAQFGNAEEGWMVRAGRQELAFGDERLIGADGDWDALGQSFDGLRSSYGEGRVRVDLFGAFLNQSRRDRATRPATRDRIYGVYSSFAQPGRGVIEPYLLWKSEHAATEACTGRREVVTYGFRSAGEGRFGLDYNLEMARQGGQAHGRSIEAWAGHWEAGYRPPSKRAVRLTVEYNFASGDDSAGDGRHTTFDDLYPAGYNKFGMADPFAWRNIRSAGGAGEWKIGRRWSTAAGYRWFWLATIKDGLYVKGDDCFVSNLTATSDAVGHQLSAGVIYEASRSLRLAAGYSRLTPGAYLKSSEYDDAIQGPFLSIEYRF